MIKQKATTPPANSKVTGIYYAVDILSTVGILEEEVARFDSMKAREADKKYEEVCAEVLKTILTRPPGAECTVELNLCIAYEVNGCTEVVQKQTQRSLALATGK